MLVLCSHCGTPLSRPPSRVKTYSAQFCNAACHDAYRRRQVPVACAICGKAWTVKASRATQNNAITCSPACLAELRSRNLQAPAEHRTAVCPTCGITFVRKPSQLEKYATNFCSKACHNASKAGPRPDRQQRIDLPCETCGKLVVRTPATREAHVFCSHKCAGRAGKPRPGHPGPGLIGPRNPNWKGGRSPYAPGWTPGLSKQIRVRDGNRCRVCGARWRPRSGNLAVHHIDLQKVNHDPANLITLCRSCHRSVHNGTLTIST